MPKEVATFLNLPEAHEYTGHSFRRSSATLLADSGAELLTLKRHGGWRSSSVAEGYIDDSLRNKEEISSLNTRNIHLARAHRRTFHHRRPSRNRLRRRHRRLHLVSPTFTQENRIDVVEFGEDASTCIAV
ncbi:unnamed protein product [Leptosia nina]|uniref:Tyr recombinase domain-containing protein n=1 Tax=Leptosia nina TaxID=320188 RepID=A0AAV1IXU8_9NEOP